MARSGSPAIEELVTAACRAGITIAAGETVEVAAEDAKKLGVELAAQLLAKGLISIAPAVASVAYAAVSAACEGAAEDFVNSRSMDIG